MLFRYVYGLRHLVLQTIYELIVTCVFVKVIVFVFNICIIAFNPLFWVQLSNKLF